MTARDHNRLLSTFFFVQAGLDLLGALIVIVLFGGFGGAMLSFAQKDEEKIVGGVFVGLAALTVILSFVFMVFHLLVGWKMHKIAPSGRILGMIASCLCLLNLPIGTALGVYGLWFFTSVDGQELYLGKTTNP